MYSLVTHIKVSRPLAYYANKVSVYNRLELQHFEQF